MKILINLSVIQSGGGLQVALSIIEEFKMIPGNEYHFLISKNIQRAINKLPDHFSFYLIDPSPSNLIKGQVSKKKIKIIEKKVQPDIVFTLFGPSYWRPKATHLCGYALPHFIYPESPFYKLISLKERIKWKALGFLKILFFKKDADYYVTETEDASQRLADILNINPKKVFTVNNAYNGIFDDKVKWKNVQEKLKSAHGFKMITISSFHIHKNVLIIPKVIDYLTTTYPNFDFTFILTMEAKKFPDLTPHQKKHILFLGKVAIEECPPLYEQSDALFMPTLLECFTVSYLEAMKMEKPILTSNLSFAHDICQDAASYFQPLDSKDIAEKIVSLVNNKVHQKELVLKGKERLKDFGTATDRAKSYIDILEKIVTENQHPNVK